MEAGEAGGEIAAPEKGADGGDGIGAQRSHGAAVVLFVAGEEIVVGVVDDLPEGRGARAARVVDGGHEGPWEHSAGQCRRAVPVSGKARFCRQAHPSSWLNSRSSRSDSAAHSPPPSRRRAGCRRGRGLSAGRRRWRVSWRLPCSAGRWRAGAGGCGRGWRALFPKEDGRGRRARFGNDIRHDERAATEVVAAFEGFAVSPHESATGELRHRRERGSETIRDGEQRAVPIPHCPGRRMDERAPAIQFWLREPQAALGRREFEASTLDGSRRERQQRWSRHGVGASVLEGPDSTFIRRIWPSISASRVEGLALVSDCRSGGSAASAPRLEEMCSRAVQSRTAFEWMACATASRSSSDTTQRSLPKMVSRMPHLPVAHRKMVTSLRPLPWWPPASGEVTTNNLHDRRRQFRAKDGFRTNRFRKSDD